MKRLSDSCYDISIKEYHHLSHIASAFFPSGYKDAIGLSIDGFGDFVSLVIAKCDGDNIKLLQSFSMLKP